MAGKSTFIIFILCLLFFTLTGCKSAQLKPFEKNFSHVKLAAGENHACVILPQGKVACWGDNVSGQLGNGKTERFSSPVYVSGLSGDTRALSAGGKHTCALLSTGKIACWGKNDRGQLGNGSAEDSAKPVYVSGIYNAVALSSGGQHTCAVLEAGNVKCWGGNDYGQLGDATTKDRLVPAAVSGLENVKSVSAGEYHACALLLSGGVACWGMNYHGELGTGTNIGPDSCSALSGTYACSKEPVRVMNISRARLLAAGGSHTCAAAADGEIMCWGSNWDGQLGYGKKLWIDLCGAGLLTSPCATSPVNVSEKFSSVSFIAAGGAHTCAVLSTGGITCWGANDYGQLGNGTQKGKLNPQSVSGLTNARSIAAGRKHTCALLSSGDVTCWGANGYGQLGTEKKRALQKCKKESCSPLPVSVRFR